MKNVVVFAKKTTAVVYRRCLEAYMLVLVTAVNHSPATAMTSSPCEI